MHGRKQAVWEALSPGEGLGNTAFLAHWNVLNERKRESSEITYEPVRFSFSGGRTPNGGIVEAPRWSGGGMGTLAWA